MNLMANVAELKGKVAVRIYIELFSKMKAY